MALKLKTEKTMVKDNTDRVKSAEASLIIQAEQIALRVSEESFNALAGRVTDAEASLTVQAGAIALKVSQSNFNALAERVGNAESSLSLQADAIALKVSSEDFTGTKIASLINLSPSEIKIKSNKITLEGLITANNNFKVLADGSIEAVNAKLSGAITATKMVSTSSAALYGEIGATDGNVGLGLFDTRYGANPYFKVRELGSSASGFNGFQIVDEFGQVRLSVEESLTRIFGPGGITWLRLTEQSVIISTPGKMETWQ